MAIDQGTKTIAIASQERTWRINIETPRGADPVVTVFRETVSTDPDGNVIANEKSVVVTRALSAIADKSYSVGGVSLTGAQIAGIIAGVADAWREEDIANPAPEAGPSRIT